MLISSLGCLFSSLISGVFLFFTADSLLFTKSDKSLANFASFFLACGDWNTAGGSLLASNCETKASKGETLPSTVLLLFPSSFNTITSSTMIASSRFSSLLSVGSLAALWSSSCCFVGLPFLVDTVCFLAELLFFLFFFLLPGIVRFSCRSESSKY